MNENDVFEVQCGTCNTDFRVKAKAAGKTIRCPHCQNPCELPTMQEIMAAQGIEPGAESNPAGDTAAAGAPNPAGPAPAGGAAKENPFQFAAAASGGSSKPAGGLPDFGAKTGPTKKSGPAKKKQPAKSPAKEPNPFEAPAATGTVSSTGTAKGLPAKRVYPALQFMRTVYYGLACFVGLGWSLFIIGSLYVVVQMGGGYMAWAIQAFTTTIGTAVMMGTLIAFAEMIKLAMDVQDNTLATAHSTAAHVPG
ncbi:MAG: hypothetical protein HKN47_05625 [Pirellulaceae bacterium]|nr:hypothetical protein [Pirellulaceae bacterium]